LINNRIGKGTLVFKNTCIAATASVVGKKEGEGPLAETYDYIGEDAYFGENTWEKAESKLQKMAAERVIKKAGITKEDVDIVIAGDLLNQCTGSEYSVNELGRSYLGIFGACSTMAEGLALASIILEGGFAKKVLAMTSSHFCTAERQFRYPLAYGSQRAPTAQWTVTGSGAFIVEEAKSNSGVFITHAVLGTPVDMGITDANNMGAAMAPSAAFTLRTFFEDTGTSPTDYDLILTGDLGYEGTKILRDLLKKENGIDLVDRHNDCGLLIYDTERQDVHAGGSGCGCSAVVLAGEIFGKLSRGELKNVLFAATGALMSTTSVQQGEPIVGITHLVRLEKR